jgi:hypothetical protein
MSNDIREFDFDTSFGKIRLRIMDMENGLLLLVSDADQYRLGFSAVAIPRGQGRNEPTSTGLFTMGLDATLVRTIAERVAAWTNKTCMIVVGVKGLNREMMMELTTILKGHLLT